MYRKQQFRGTAGRCDLCQSDVSHFSNSGVDLPIVQKRQIVGALPFANDICPVCYGASRVRLMCHFLETEGAVGQRPLRFLHVAPDIGMYYWLERQKKIDYVPTDLSPERYTIVPNVTKQDLTQLTFADESFDVVVVSHVLEHVPDDHKAMQEVHRILRQDGYALFIGPEAIDGAETVEDPWINDPEEQKRRFAQRDHVRIYSREDFVNRLRQTGFEVSAFGPDQIPEAIQKSKRLNPAEILWVARRAD